MKRDKEILKERERSEKRARLEKQYLIEKSSLGNALRFLVTFLMCIKGSKAFILYMCFPITVDRIKNHSGHLTCRQIYVYTQKEL